MPRISTYSIGQYPDGQERTMPWKYWTDEQRSLVIRESYRNCILTSKQIKPYLDASRQHFYAQWIVPLAVGALCFGPFRGTVLANAYKKHPHLGYKYSAAILGGFTLFWLNLSPFYVRKESSQVETLRTLFSKIGFSMKIYNQMIPTSTTSTNIDKDTWEIYSGRNSRASGVFYPEEDQAPPIMPITAANTNIKKKYL